jgi:hypothetical protein
MKPKSQKIARESRSSLDKSTSPKRILYTRAEAAELLGGCSIYLLKTLESRGALTPVRLNRWSRTSQVFYRAEELLRVTKEGGE